MLTLSGEKRFSRAQFVESRSTAEGGCPHMDPPKQKGDLFRSPYPSCKWLLDSLYVLGLPPFRAFNYVELHLLPFLQAAESTRLNGREVYEYVLAVLAADKTITLGVVKPLYCSCFHGSAWFLYVEIALSFR